VAGEAPRRSSTIELSANPVFQSLISRVCLERAGSSEATLDEKIMPIDDEER